MLNVNTKYNFMLNWVLTWDDKSRELDTRELWNSSVHGHFGWGSERESADKGKAANIPRQSVASRLRAAPPASRGQTGRMERRSLPYL